MTRTRRFRPAPQAYDVTISRDGKAGQFYRMTQQFGGSAGSQAPEERPA